MIAEILCVGTELLMGQVLNTNAQFLSRRLSALGITQQHQTVVGDNAQRLEDAYRLALSRADIVITSGGLGPTNPQQAINCFIIGVFNLSFRQR